MRIRAQDPKGFLRAVTGFTPGYLPPRPAGFNASMPLAPVPGRDAAPPNSPASPRDPAATCGLRTVGKDPMARRLSIG